MNEHIKGDFATFEVVSFIILILIQFGGNAPFVYEIIVQGERSGKCTWRMRSSTLVVCSLEAFVFLSPYFGVYFNDLVQERPRPPLSPLVSAVKRCLGQKRELVFCYYFQKR